MNLITNTLGGLVRRKLWPVALLLVGALVAVPFTLAKQPDPTPVAAAPHAAQAEGLPATFVSETTDTEDGERRRVLGEKKDPFAPAPLSAKAKAARRKAAKKDAASNADTAAGDSAKSSGGAAAAGGGSASPSEPPASAAPAPQPTVPQYSIKVNFGPVDGALETKTVERLTVLPSEETPVLVYRGVEAGGKVAVFELTGSVIAQGDGACEPTPEDCQVLKLRAGETEFLTISDTGKETDAQYQLDVEKIYSKTTAVSESAPAEASSAGRTQLRKWSNDRGARYAFDPQTGTLHKLSAKSAERLTRSARRASL